MGGVWSKKRGGGGGGGGGGMSSKEGGGGGEKSKARTAAILRCGGKVPLGRFRVRLFGSGGKFEIFSLGGWNGALKRVFRFMFVLFTAGFLMHLQNSFKTKNLHQIMILKHLALTGMTYKLSLFDKDY